MITAWYLIKQCIKNYAKGIKNSRIQHTVDRSSKHIDLTEAEPKVYPLEYVYNRGFAAEKKNGLALGISLN